MLLAMVVATIGRHDGTFQQTVVAVYGSHGDGREGEEAEVGKGGTTGREEHVARVGAEAPVIVLAGAVDAREGFLVQ